MKRYPYVSDWRTVGSYQVHRYGILTTPRIIFAVYEAHAGHSSFMTGPAGVWVGQVTSRPLPSELDAIPVRVDGAWNQARFDAIDAWRASLESECRKAIVAVYPEASSGTARGGEYEVWTSDEGSEAQS
jgi:hypothetical protein